MKKALLLGMAVLLVLSMVFVGCSDDPVDPPDPADPFDGNVNIKGGKIEVEITNPPAPIDPYDGIIKNKPQPVTNFTATAYPGAILLTWEAAVDALEYDLFRTEQGGKTQYITSFEVDTVWYLDKVEFEDNENILKNNVSYTYKIVSHNNNAGGNVAEASANVTADVPKLGSTIFTDDGNVNTFKLPQPITASDIEILFYNPVWVAPNGAASQELDTMRITLKKINPLVSYSVVIYQKDLINDTWSVSDVDDGEALNDAVVFSYSADNIDGKKPLDTQTKIVEIENLDRDLDYRAVIECSLISDTYYNTTTYNKNHYIRIELTKSSLF